jgi:hypothetical protein
MKPTVQDRQHGRFYFDPLARYFIRGYALIGMFVGFVVAVAPIPAYSTLSRHHVALILVRVGCGAVVVLSIFGWRLAGRFGVVVGTDGIAVRRRYGIRSRAVGWRDIRTFRSTESLVRIVYAELWSGETVRTALVQGRKMRWHGGATRDVVSVLNGDLAQANAIAGTRGRPARPPGQAATSG